MHDVPPTTLLGESCNANVRRTDQERPLTHTETHDILLLGVVHTRSSCSIVLYVNGSASSAEVVPNPNNSGLGLRQRTPERGGAC